MKRRKALQGILLFSLGTGVVYSCRDKYQAIRDLNLQFVKPDDHEIDLISGISRSILPLHKIEALVNHTPVPFILKMVEDCENDQSRESFIDAYKTISISLKETHLELEEGDAYLQLINTWKQGKDGSKDEDNTFFGLVKKYSIIYLENTEYYQRNIRYYQMAPGYFQGDIHIDDWVNRNAV